MENLVNLFPPEVTLQSLNQLCEGNMGSYLGIEFIELGSDYLKARMPVDSRTKQPFGLLHGGASVALSETIASVAANAVLLPEENLYAVGLEINANHIKAATSGYVIATCKPLQLGKRISVWEVKICNEGGSLVCVSRMTAALLPRKRN